MGLVQIVNRGNMFFWDYQYVGWCLGIQIPERKDLVILVNLIRCDLPRNHLAKKTIAQEISPFDVLTVAHAGSECVQ